MAWTEDRYIKHMDNYFSTRVGQDHIVRFYGPNTPERLLNILASMGYYPDDILWLQVNDRTMKRALDILRMMEG